MDFCAACIKLPFLVYLKWLHHFCSSKCLKFSVISLRLRTQFSPAYSESLGLTQTPAEPVFWIVLFNFLCAIHRKISSPRIAKIIFNVSSGGRNKKPYSIFLFLLSTAWPRVSTKARQNSSVSAVISWIAQWGSRKSGCTQQTSAALKQQPCCERDIFSL